MDPFVVGDVAVVTTATDSVTVDQSTGECRVRAYLTMCLTGTGGSPLTNDQILVLSSIGWQPTVVNVVPIPLGVGEFPTCQRAGSAAGAWMDTVLASSRLQWAGKTISISIIDHTPDRSLKSTEISSLIF